MDVKPEESSPCPEGANSLFVIVVAFAEIRQRMLCTEENRLPIRPF